MPWKARPVHKKGTMRWKSREAFITEVLRRERIGLPAPMEHSKSTSDRCIWNPRRRNGNIQPDRQGLP